MYKPKNPVGYKTLFTWRQAGEIYRRSKDLAASYLVTVADKRLAAHIIDSARSVQRNIEEGYKRATTKEYVQFLGFSRGSLEELKGDLEELKREWREGIRWGNKGDIRGTGFVGGTGVRGEESVTGAGVQGAESVRGPGVRAAVISEIEELLKLVYGEDCMMGRQIISLEKKMVSEKTLPRSEMIKRVWNKAASDDERFWRIAESKYGLKRGHMGKKREEGKREEDIRRGDKRVSGGEEKIIEEGDGRSYGEEKGLKG